MPWPQTVPCTVRTSKTKVVQSKSWLLQQLEFRAFGPAKPSGPRLLSTFIWLNITDLLSFKLLWMLSSFFYCTVHIPVILNLHSLRLLLATSI